MVVSDGGFAAYGSLGRSVQQIRKLADVRRDAHSVSALGHQLPRPDHIGMSGSLPKADKRDRSMCGVAFQFESDEWQ
jgi:hypothetical protein